MPIYEYLCADCQNRFEALRPIAQADAPIHCQRCRGTHISRQVSAAYAHVGGRTIVGDGQRNRGCSNCSGGSCNTCGR